MIKSAKVVAESSSVCSGKDNGLSDWAFCHEKLGLIFWPCYTFFWTVEKTDLFSLLGY